MATPPSPKAPPARVVLENLTTARIMIPGEGEKILTLGNRLDTDERIAGEMARNGLEGADRDPKHVPSPVQTLTGAEYEALGTFAHGIIDDFVSQKHIRRTELAA